MGEAIQIDGQGRMTGFLSCPYCPPDPSFVTLFPLSLTGNVGTNQQIYPTIHWADGTSFINQNPWAIDWYPGSSSVATVSENWSNFQVQFQGPGSTQMDAKMPNECHYEWNHFVSECDCPYYVLAAAQTPAQVKTRTPWSAGVVNTTAQGAAVCGAGQAGWSRSVTLQLRDQWGDAYAVGGITMADTIQIGSPNQLGIQNTQTGSFSTDGNGRWPDTYFVCSTACPSSGQSSALQFWTFGGVNLPHVNAVVYKCASITIDGQ